MRVERSVVRAMVEPEVRVVLEVGSQIDGREDVHAWNRKVSMGQLGSIRSRTRRSKAALRLGARFIPRHGARLFPGHGMRTSSFGFAVASFFGLAVESPLAPRRRTSSSCWGEADSGIADVSGAVLDVPASATGVALVAMHTTANADTTRDPTGNQ